MLVFLVFFPPTMVSLTILFQSSGCEPYRAVSWSQGAVIAPPTPSPTFFSLRFCAFFKMYVYVCVDAKLTFVIFFDVSF